MENELRNIVRAASELRKRGLALLDANCACFAGLLSPADARAKLDMACKIAEARYEEAEAAQDVLQAIGIQLW